MTVDAHLPSFFIDEICLAERPLHHWKAFALFVHPVPHNPILASERLGVIVVDDRHRLADLVVARRLPMEAHDEVGNGPYSHALLVTFEGGALLRADAPDPVRVEAILFECKGQNQVLGLPDRFQGRPYPRLHRTLQLPLLGQPRHGRYTAHAREEITFEDARLGQIQRHDAVLVAIDDKLTLEFVNHVPPPWRSCGSSCWGSCGSSCGSICRSSFGVLLILGAHFLPVLPGIVSVLIRIIIAVCGSFQLEGGVAIHFRWRLSGAPFQVQKIFLRHVEGSAENFERRMHLATAQHAVKSSQPARFHVGII
mmetsp:Transcript_61282/g.162895  ORF Transcript_61282/g.162895 Transcript_61282/m.162895 type:complete len:310 (+) Transcript_61282:556-1485(+)